VSWIAARKHMLAAVFILAATLAADETGRIARPRDRIIGAVFYLGSVLSQPITVLWPLWVGLDVALRRGLRPAIRAVSLVGPLMAIAVTANVAYYSGEYVRQVGNAKFVDVTGTGSVSLLALGRYVFNDLLPIAIATTYYPGRLFNLLGLVLLPLLVLLSSKALPWRRVVSGWAFIAFSLVPVTLRMTNIFVSDSYSMTALAGIIMLGVEIFCARVAVGVFWELGAVGVSAVVALLTIQSSRVAQSYRSDAALWHFAYASEPSPGALAREAFYLASEGRASEARTAAERLLQWDPGQPEGAHVFARAVYLDTTLSPDEKLSLLDGAPVQNSWTGYFAAMVEASSGRFFEAQTRMLRLAQGPSQFGSEAAHVAADARRICQRAGASGCDELAATIGASQPGGMQ
jgi:hypothetical protein